MKRRAVLGALAVPVALLTGCAAGDRPVQLQRVVRVPQDAPSITAAVGRVEPGGLVLVGPGTYRESVTILKEGITLRGTDRNDVVLDGEGERSNGVVAGASGITVENLTVQRYLLNGVLVTGVVDEGGIGIGRGSDGYRHLDTERFPPVPGFAVNYVTAINNGLYGVYAFNRQHGVIANSYASGSADAGFYVGQCVDCDIEVTRNVAEFNAVGYESANSTGVRVIGNRFARNRVGLTMTSDHQEAYAPQRRALIAGNVIVDNNEAATPEQADGGFGIGIGLAGTDGVVVRGNRVEGNRSAGLMLSPAEDLPAQNNEVRENRYRGNRTDVVYEESIQSGHPQANCVRVPPGTSTFPPVLPAIVACAEYREPVGSIGDVRFPVLAAPAGVPFLDVTPPGRLPTMPLDPVTAPFGPADGPAPLAPADVPRVPRPDWLLDASRARPIR